MAAGAPRRALAARRGARRVLGAETAEYAERAGVTVTRVSIGDPRGRWGSCASWGAIRYSWRLILAPDLSRRATVAHEVAHWIHMNHVPVVPPAWSRRCSKPIRARARTGCAAKARRCTGSADLIRLLGYDSSVARGGDRCLRRLAAGVAAAGRDRFRRRLRRAVAVPVIRSIQSWSSCSSPCRDAAGPIGHLLAAVATRLLVLGQRIAVLVDEHAVIGLAIAGFLVRLELPFGQGHLPVSNFSTGRFATRPCIMNAAKARAGAVPPCRPPTTLRIVAAHPHAGGEARSRNR